MPSLTTISHCKRREKSTAFIAPMTASGFCFTRSREVAKKKRAAGERQNRCVSRTLTLNNQPSTTYYLYDGWQLAEELNGSGTEQALYVNGARTDELLYKATSAATVFYQHDGLGNTTALTDASGNLVEHYTYDVFGKPSIYDASGNSLTASAYGNRFLYTGREWLQEVGLYDYRNRIYSADLGRFLQTDPLRFSAGDVNVYRYVGNNAARWVDPSGESAVSTWGEYGAVGSEIIGGGPEDPAADVAAGTILTAAEITDIAQGLWQAAVAAAAMNQAAKDQDEKCDKVKCHAVSIRTVGAGYMVIFHCDDGSTWQEPWDGTPLEDIPPIDKPSDGE